MNTKIIFAFISFTLVCLELTNALKCFSCSSFEQCKKPTLEICNEVTTNTTYTALHKYNTGVPAIVVSENFNCLESRWFAGSSNENVTIDPIEVLGCIYKNEDICSYLRLKPEFTNQEDYTIWIDRCKYCETDGCNSANIFGSHSGLYAVLASLITFVVAKSLA